MRFTLTALTLFAAANVWAGQPHGALERRQETVAQRGAEVMPFELAATVHMFKKTADGGIQQVVARDRSDATQIRLIRRHLREIQQEFMRRDFSSPATIHGNDMPGLATLRNAKPDELLVYYRNVAAGAELVYHGSDAETIKAVHQWFDAQVSDHGADAIEMHHHHSK
ncbi:aspartate carbamoyltransferase [Noviherbaspirillum pedocola]|uniref:Aspartate carbamoyltransferase n=1 Tax=Noviherbaspirillum pedocola TaxID=2801341 RepID=A0A934W779_9BURK|nr:aspartate carbamoyltransferase [Noviherbaspirillum pedocola]MBK4737097.1 aspartate carbamoyltransferase [Noviherbaspirillum pedocola]